MLRRPPARARKRRRKRTAAERELHRHDSEKH